MSGVIKREDIVKMQTESKTEDHGAAISGMRAEFDRVSKENEELKLKIIRLEGVIGSMKNGQYEQVGMDRANREIIALLIDRLGDR